jgi:flagellar hook-associated protein FlgK
MMRRATMIDAINSAASGMERVSRDVASIPVKMLRASLDNGKNLSEQIVNMVSGSRVYDANAKVIETSEKMLDIMV